MIEPQASDEPKLAIRQQKDPKEDIDLTFKVPEVTEMTLEEEEEEYKSFKTELKKSVSNNKVPLYKDLYQPSLVTHLLSYPISKDQKKKRGMLNLCSNVQLSSDYFPTLLSLSSKDPLWRLQSWIYAFIESIFLKKVFKDKVNDYITLHTHGTTHHLPSFTDYVVCTLE